MTDDDLLADWARRRAAVDVPPGLLRRVMDALPEDAPASAAPAAAPATPLLRAAVLLLAAAACLFRAFQLLDLFLV